MQKVYKYDEKNPRIKYRNFIPSIKIKEPKKQFTSIKFQCVSYLNNIINIKLREYGIYTCAKLPFDLIVDIWKNIHICVFVTLFFICKNKSLINLCVKTVSFLCLEISYGKKEWTVYYVNLFWSVNYWNIIMKTTVLWIIIEDISIKLHSSLRLH